MLKYIPRIDLNPPEPEPEAKEDNGKKRKKRTAQSAYRPPARLFNADDIKNAFGQKQVSYRNGIFGFQGEEFRDGFCEKEHRMPTLQLEDVNPTIDEITRFTGDKPAGRRRDEDDDEDDEGRRADADSAMNLNLIAAATKQAAKAALQPGDHVEIYRGGQKGLIGTIKAITGDILAIVPESADLGTDPVEIEADYVRKRFKVGDNVRVMSGVQAGERGLVVAIEDAEVTLMSSLTGQEVKVFSKDLRDAAEQDAAVVTRSVYDLHDLVQIEYVCLVMWPKSDTPATAHRRPASFSTLRTIPFTSSIKPGRCGSSRRRRYPARCRSTCSKWQRTRTGP
jgi:transcription elongation factor SPT5